MYRRIFSFLFCFPLISAFAQQDVSSSIAATLAKWNMPGMSALAVKDGEIVAQGAAGIRRVGSSEGIGVGDIINIASCTKWMTATVAGRLVDRGVMSWSTRIKDVFQQYENFDSAFHDATLEQFLAHRTGLQDSDTFVQRHFDALFQQTGTVVEIRRWVTETILSDAPSVLPESFLYANQGYTVAAAMMEIVSGKSWETLIREEIFEPLRMNSAFIGESFNNSESPRAPIGHDYVNSAWVPRMASSESYHLRVQAAWGPGGYVSCTLNDWAKFLHAHATTDLSRFLSDLSDDELQSPYGGSSGYGKGVHALFRDWADPGFALTHSGDIFGHRTVTWMAPAHNFFVVVFTNGRSVDNSTFEALDEVAGNLVADFSQSIAGGIPLEKPVLRTIGLEQAELVLNGFTLPAVGYEVQYSENLKTWSTLGNSDGIATEFRSDWRVNYNGKNEFFRIRTIPKRASRSLADKGKLHYVLQSRGLKMDKKDYFYDRSAIPLEQQ